MNGIERMKAETSMHLDVLRPGATGLGAGGDAVSSVKLTPNGFLENDRRPFLFLGTV